MSVLSVMVWGGGSSSARVHSGICIGVLRLVATARDDDESEDAEDC